MGISAKQFSDLQERVRGVRRKEAAVATPPRRYETILGIDPSLRGTGYGILRLAKPHDTAVVHGTISCPAGWERSRCLVRIAEHLRAVIREHQPEVCAIEGLFFAQNLQTALIMGEARGAALVAAAEAGILGCMPSLNARTPQKFREDLEWIRARTDRPIGINLTLG
ncbi:MAG TPA: hypothetical protein DCM86_16760, partial [Verrucomicrobiales bacterium]|nr:hypothetical protein [Verrucomicrobiales bacterium]